STDDRAVARRLTRATTIAAGALGASAAFVVGLALTGIASPVGERALNRVHRRGPYRASPRAVELHRSVTVVDLHADSLLWGRDLRRRASYGHIDVPRLIDRGDAGPARGEHGPQRGAPRPRDGPRAGPALAAADLGESRGTRAPPRAPT